MSKGPPIKSYTAHVKGNVVRFAKSLFRHVYYVDGVTAIEIKATSKGKVREILEWNGLEVLYIYE